MLSFSYQTTLSIVNNNYLVCYNFFIVYTIIPLWATNVKKYFNKGEIKEQQNALNTKKSINWLFSISEYRKVDIFYENFSEGDTLYALGACPPGCPLASQGWPVGS